MLGRIRVPAAVVGCLLQGASLTAQTPPSGPEVCRGEGSDRGTGVITGVVESASEAGLGDLVIEVQWREPVHIDLGVVPRDLATATLRLPVGEKGDWVACGLPTGREIRVVALAPGAGGSPASEPHRVLLEEGEAPAHISLPVLTPVELQGLTVSLARRVRRDLLDIGIRREAIGRRFISTEDIAENIPGAMDGAHLVERQRIPGVGVKLDGDIQCVFMRRGTGLAKRPTPGVPTGSKVQYCANLVVDGVPSHPTVLRLMVPEVIAAMAFLSPLEAGVRFGRSPGGILFIWTHGGR